MFKSLFHEKQLIGPQKYTFTGSKSSQNASIFHEKNDGGVKFFIGYPYTAGRVVKEIKSQKRYNQEALSF